MTTLRQRANDEGISNFDLDHLNDIIKGDPERSTWFAARRLRRYFELMEHADAINMARLRMGFPATCDLLMTWYNTKPAKLPAVLDREEPDDLIHGELAHLVEGNHEPGDLA